MMMILMGLVFFFILLVFLCWLKVEWFVSVSIGGLVLVMGKVGRCCLYLLVYLCGREFAVGVFGVVREDVDDGFVRFLCFEICK